MFLSTFWIPAFAGMTEFDVSVFLLGPLSGHSVYLGGFVAVGPPLLTLGLIHTPVC